MLNQGLGVDEVDGVLGSWVMMEDSVVRPMLRTKLETAWDILAQMYLRDFVSQPPFAGLAGKSKLSCDRFELHRCYDFSSTI